MAESVLGNTILVERRMEVEKALHSVIESSMEGPYAPAMELAREILLAGGKRIRPILTLLAYDLVGGQNRSDVIDFAVATELIHTATLIHDDIYDGAKLRRGVQTLHEKHGLDHAIIGGDFLFVMGFGIGGRYEEKIVRIMASTCAAIAAGELKQLQHVSDLSTTPEDYYEIVRGKTAGPFSSACECAAIIAGASEPEIEAMREFGMELGVAFQLVDDLLDLTSDSETLGKPAGNDILEGTYTLPVLIALTKDKGKYQEILTEIKEENIDIENVLNEFTTKEIIDDSKEIINGYLNKSIEAIFTLKNHELFPVLENINNYLINRTN